jgi:hypothetical protein
VEKEQDQFPRRKDNSTGYRTDCKECRRIGHQAYYQENKARRLISSNNWRKNNPEKSNATYARYRKTEKRKIVANRWAAKNRKTMQAYNVKKYNTDPQFNIATKIRRRISMAIHNQYTKKATLTVELLGCSFLELKSYIESKFTLGMTWDKILSVEIHLDHIRPCASFDLTDPEQQKQCFNYKNLQPLWAKDNLQKSDKWEAVLEA